MNENTAKQPAISTPPAGIVRVGVDLAKRSIQVHGVDASGKVLINRALSRERFLPWCAQLPSGCTVAMEACSGAHFWARQLIERGLTPKIIPAALVSPYRIQGASGKNDANDAAAICEAASRPQMRFVLPKSAHQQSMLCIHRLREGLKSDRTACINRIRGLLSEFGLVFAQGSKALRQEVTLALEDASNALPGLARLGITQACEHWRHLDEQMLWCDQRIAAHAKEDPQVNAAMQIIGIGPITASAAVATVGDFKQFNSGAQFGAWLGLVPRQHSSGGKASLGRITKRGDTYLRMLLIQAAKSAVLTAHRRQDTLSQWMLKLRESRGWQRAAVALANKNARILWAILSKAGRYDPMHVSIKPAAVVAVAAQ